MMNLPEEASGGDGIESKPLLNEEDLVSGDPNGNTDDRLKTSPNPNCGIDEEEEDVPSMSYHVDHLSSRKVFGVIPAFGWSVPMTHTFQEKWKQNMKPRLSQIPDLLPLALRYIFFRVYMWFKGRQPVIDCFTLNGKRIYGEHPFGFMFLINSSCPRSIRKGERA